MPVHLRVVALVQVTNAAPAKQITASGRGWPVGWQPANDVSKPATMAAAVTRSASRLDRALRRWVAMGFSFSQFGLARGALPATAAHRVPFPRKPNRERLGCGGYGPAMDLVELQDIIERTYGDRDRERGVSATVAWLAEEIGELAQAVRKGTYEQQVHEFGDVIAWVATLANQQGIDLTVAAERFAAGCPKCAALPCAC